MKILLIGGTGVLSTAITNEALRKNIDVYMINRGNRMELIPHGVHLLKADVKNKELVISLLKNSNFDAIIDFLCYNEKDIKYSFDLFKNMTNQYVFISSCAVYNSRVCNFCEEDSPKVLSVWDYSINKNKCEDFLRIMAKNNNTKFTIIRPSVNYGNTRIPYGITPPMGYHWTLVERILNRKPIITWNNGNNRCNITHVDDFAVGVIGLLGNEAAYNEVFNVVGDETPSWNEVLDVLSNLLKKEIKRFDIPSEYYAKEMPARKGELLGGRAIDSINSNKKIISVVKEFKQTIMLKEGLMQTLDYYQKHNYIYGIDYGFDADTDRIIIKYAKENNISIQGLNLSYIDYLKNKKRKNKVYYFLYKNKDSTLFKSLNMIRHGIFLLSGKA
jgi:nucleoside-diphosphate-sugar epimerase